MTRTSPFRPDAPLREDQRRQAPPAAPRRPRARALAAPARFAARRPEQEVPRPSSPARRRPSRALGARAVRSGLSTVSEARPRGHVTVTGVSARASRRRSRGRPGQAPLVSHGLARRCLCSPGAARCSRPSPPDSPFAPAVRAGLCAPSAALRPRGPRRPAQRSLTHGDPGLLRPSRGTFPLLLCRRVLT